ncbi:FAD-dependent oxidoreductase [Schumannella luteola]
MHSSHPEPEPAAPWDVIVIGGGAAGLSAALILSRAQRRVLVIDAAEPRNRFAPHMHGVLGRNATSPLELVADGRREVQASGGVVVEGRVIRTTATAHGFDVETADGSMTSARRLVVATGLRDELPDLPGLAEQWGRGVVACPYCDGFESAGRRFGVLLGSAAGIHKAHLLAPYSADITVFSGLAGELAADDRLILEQRGIRLEGRGVAAIESTGDTLSGVRLTDGTLVPVDVVFAEPRPVALDGPLLDLGAETAESAFGAWVAVDATGRTSVPGVWAVGNVANPGALVPLAMGAGAAAALAINGELVAEEVASSAERARVADPREFWENRYRTERREHGRVWSGEVNSAVAQEIADLAPGRALELGCGEGADAVWLAERGWTVTGVDISATALEVAAAAASEGGVADRVEWVRADLADRWPEGEFDLVTASFLHSPVELDRDRILRRAAAAVALGGTLLVVGHAAFPPGSQHAHTDAPPLPTAEDVLASLELAPGWTVVTCEQRDRDAIGRDGHPVTLVDSVLRVRREQLAI